MSTEPSATPIAAPHLANPTAPQAILPARSCDTHAHVFGPGRTYEFIEDNLYLPSDALPRDYGHMLDVAGFSRAVLVQPSVYGFNNECMLDAIAADPDRLRGIAVIPFDADDAMIAKLDTRGIRGIRINIVDLKRNAGVLDFDLLRRLAQRIAPHGWHVEFLMHVDEFSDLDQRLKDFPVDVCFGHFGYVPLAKGSTTRGFEALLRLMRDGNAWVKLSAPYRLTLDEPPYPGIESTIQRLLEAAPDRLVYGTDWPHVRVKSRMPDDGRLLDLFAEWVPEERVRQKILVDNPARLYGFNGPGSGR